jgi:ketosteroid isomerase-like protein
MSHVSEPAREPDDLARFFLDRVNAGDLEGLVALYESDAVLACPDGSNANGTGEIRAFYSKLLAGHPQFVAGKQLALLRMDGLALTSSRLADASVTVEVARMQSDGTWLWAIDQPSIIP